LPNQFVLSLPLSQTMAKTRLWVSVKKPSSTTKESNFMRLSKKEKLWVKNQYTDQLLNHLISFGKIDTLSVLTTMVESQRLPSFLFSSLPSHSLLFSLSKNCKLRWRTNGQLLNLITIIQQIFHPLIFRDLLE
jgi:hypothetical protein